MKKALAALLALLMVLSLAACGGSGGKEDQSMLGTYTLYAMDYDENTAILASELFEGSNYITLKSGGAAEMCLENDVSNVKWKLDGTKLTISAADGDMNGTLKNGILTLEADGSNLYYAAPGASTDGIKALTLDELLNGAFSDIGGDTPSNDPGGNEPEPAAPVVSGPSELQQMWNGWYYGCIDMDGCTDNWAFLNGATYDAVLYVELDRDGVGRFAIYDPFGNLIANEHSNIYVDAACHADTNYLYADSGTAFNDDLKPSDWMFVHNLAIPEKLNVGSTSTEENGATIGYDFQFKPWGDLWEGDSYAQFIPNFDAYVDAIGAGLSSPFGDTFPGFGIAEVYDNGGSQPAEQPSSGEPSGTSSGELSPLLGSNPAKLDINNKGAVFVYYPADRFRYDADYGKLKNDSTGVGILIDPMLGATNLAELKASYEKNNSDEDEYSLVETTVNGYKAIILKYSDWLGSTMRVDIDFGGNHDGYYGMSFAVSGDSLKDCDTDLVWAIINSMELAK